MKSSNELLLGEGCYGLSNLGWTGRVFGHSKGLYKGLNLGFHVGDDPHAVKENRAELSAKLGRKLIWMDQSHSDRVYTVCMDRNCTKIPTDPVSADGLIWDTRNWGGPELALAVMVADCIPLALMSEDASFLAVVHAGRVGIVKNIIGKAVEKLRQMGADLTTLQAFIGPHICGRCYAVGAKISKEMDNQLPGIATTVHRSDSQIEQGVDLALAAKIQLRNSGVHNIKHCGICTFENEEFYSYRRQKTTGRQVLLAWRS